ncbi:MAG: ATP-binding protein [Peptococcaceae bacterium]|jgi:hypothetical protein|nr:ATP-binding protein [Peptococcaceae bacterium]
MQQLLLFQIFEGVAAVFDTFIVYQYVSGILEKRRERRERWGTWPWYAVFGLGLILLSLFYRAEIILIIYTLVGVYALARGLYKSSLSSRIFSVFYFAAIMMGSEIFCSGLVSGLWHIDVTNTLEYGLPRVLCIVVAKLIQIFLVKISVSVIQRQTNHPARDELKLMLPLLLCQVFSIMLAYYVFVICVEVYGGFRPVALWTMIGVVYMNIIVFWYFDRIKLAFAYKSKNEAAELKLELQKQYFEILTEHQQETDILWHDMKKHIQLMKTLLNRGQQELTAGYIQELEWEMNDKIKVVRTEHPVLSALLSEQTQRAKKAGIRFELDVRLGSTMKIAPLDLCVILGNLYENAFAACLSLPSETEKQITAAIVQRHTALVIHIENACDATVKPRRRAGKHGLGLKNVQRAVNKYGGKMDIIRENGIYRVEILVP